MKFTLLLLSSLIMISCGKNGKDGSDGVNGADLPRAIGLSGVSTAVDFEDIPPGLACANGGTSIFTFKDTNGDGHFQNDEELIKVKSICDGTNGIDGETPYLSVENFSSSTDCPSGGVRITSQELLPAEVCHGLNGLDGSAGAPGSHGTSIVPVKFCTSDSSTYPEYGLLIGEDLFAVHWGKTPASPNTPQAFLSKLIPGNYRSTGGNNCLFSVL